MDELTSHLLEELKRLHGDDLELENHNYYMFFKDGLFQLYLDVEEKSIKVESTLLDEGQAKVYFSDVSASEIIG